MSYQYSCIECEFEFNVDFDEEKFGKNNNVHCPWCGSNNTVDDGEIENSDEDEEILDL